MFLFCLNYRVSVSLQIPIFLVSTLLLTVISYWMIGKCPKFLVVKCKRRCEKNTALVPARGGGGIPGNS